MKSLLKNFLYLSILIFSILSCDSGEAEKKPATNPRTIKYELTGDFQGTDLLVSYSPATGNPEETETITGLPWSKEITVDPTVKSINFRVFGGGGIKGQNIILKLYSGGFEVKTRTNKAIANEDGAIEGVMRTHTFSFE
jgi:hypothetical protein